MKKDTHINPYLGTSDVENMYETLKGTRKGITSFIQKAKEIATRSKGGAYIFKDEEALFELFKAELPEEIKRKRIRYVGELVQMIS